MKKLTTAVFTLIFLTTLAAKAEVGIGVSGGMYAIDIDGTETTRQSNQKNSGSHSEDVMVPEEFVEAITDSGKVFGIAYIPTREMGNKSRSDTNSAGDTGTYTAKAELDNVIQLYTDLPMIDAGSFPIHLKLGVQHATITTLESLNSGSSYPDEDVFGYTIGLGTKGDLPGNLYYKLEVAYTDFEDYNQSSDSSAPNKVSADLEATSAKLSIGYKF